MIVFSLSRIYGIIADLRHKLYENDILKSHSLGRRTISIGNITFGGTGKTPFTAFAAEVLIQNGEKVCIISRGYGRENPKRRVLVADGKEILADVKTAGDEPFELAHKLRGKAVIIADANRVEAAKWACENFPVTVFLLDDAFQHVQAKRDLDIVLIDATKPFEILREPLKNLKRADLIVITRTNLSEKIPDLKAEISNFNLNCPIFTAENKVSNLIELEGFFRQTVKSQPLNTDPCLAFCALGNPENFFEQLRGENFNIALTVKFPDHYFYKAKDIEKLERIAAEASAKYLITTAKDAVKLKNLRFNLPCYVAENRMIFDNEDALREIISSIQNLKSKN